MSALCREGSWDPGQSPEPCPCPGVCPQDSSLCQLRSSDVPWPGWGWLGAVPRAVPAPGRGGESASLCCDMGAEPPCTQPCLCMGLCLSPALGTTAAVALALPKSSVSPLHPSASWMGLCSQQAETNNRLTPFIMFILTFCPEMGTVLHKESC